MLNRKIIVMLVSSLAAICFLINYFINGNTINLILGFAWICITICYYMDIKKTKK